MKKSTYNPLLMYILAVDGFIFLRSGYGKVAGGEFVNKLGNTLGYFASENPYPFVKSLLVGFAVPNAQLLGILTMFGEIVAGLGIMIAAGYFLYKKTLSRFMTFVLLGALMGAFVMNLSFWLASGWTSPSADSLNLLMMTINGVGIMFAMRFLKRNK